MVMVSPQPPCGWVGVAEGSLEVKLPTVWIKWKSRDGKNQRREEKKKEDQTRERVRRKKMQVREKVEESRNTVFFPMTCGSRGSKSKAPLKWVGVEPSGQM